MSDKAITLKGMYEELIAGYKQQIQTIDELIKNYRSQQESYQKLLEIHEDKYKEIFK